MTKGKVKKLKEGLKGKTVVGSWFQGIITNDPATDQFLVLRCARVQYSGVVNPMLPRVYWWERVKGEALVIPLSHAGAFTVVQKLPYLRSDK
ncbi:MAG: hypothetical protein WAV25_00030 [Minisyncoccia bacterium]